MPTLVARFMAKLRASSSQFFRIRYDFAIIEWRIIAFLAAEGPCSAYQINTRGHLDKAAISRALTILATRGLVTIAEQPSHRRRMALVSLTPDGERFNEEAFELLTARHERLVAGLTPAELDAFIATLRKLEERIAAMDGPAVPR